MTREKDEHAAGSTNDLVKPTHEGAIELDETALDEVSGGKAKTADKAFEAMDKYIRG